MFTTTLPFPEELLPCKIGDTIYTIEENKDYKTGKRIYSIEQQKCEGFMFRKDYINKTLQFYPAYCTMDGWCEIFDDNCMDNHYGYYTDREEVVAKKKELEEIEEMRQDNKWLEELDF